MKEVWKRWSPTIFNESMHKACYAVVKDTEELEFNLVFNDTDDIVKIVFQYGVLSYQNTDEGKRLRAINYLVDNYDDDFYGDWTLFEVEKSSFLNWFQEENYGIYQDDEIKHLVLLTSNDVVDILTDYEPKVSIVEHEVEKL